MNKIVQRTVYTGVLLLTFLMCTAGIISSFVFGENLQTLLNSVLKLRIYEPYIGGKVITSVFDPMHDDTGSGTAVYPANSFYEEGNLDLVLYTVHEPVYHAPWQTVPEYWQLDLKFRTGFSDVHNPQYNRSVYVYLDCGNDAEGSVSTVFEQGENIRFNPEHPWDYAIAAAGIEGYIYNSKGVKIDTLEVVYSADGKKIMIRIPLTKKELHYLYSAQTTNHYVLVGAYSLLDYANILPLAKRRSKTSGGGLTNSLMPKIYDVLFDGDQSAMLSSWNEDTFEFAQIEPVLISMKESAAAKDLPSQQRIAALQEELELLYNDLASYRAGRMADLKKELSPSNKVLEELALLALNTGDRVTAEKLFTQLRSKDSNNPTYIAYSGTLESMKGAEASVVAAVEAVNKGYVLLDQAVLLTEGTLEKVKNKAAAEEEILHRLNALLNRGGNSQSVPNTVFLKAAQGAEDYLEGAEIARLTGYPVLAARCYYDAAVCYSLDDKKSDALVWKRESARAVKALGDDASLNLEDRVQLTALQLALLKEGLLE